MATRPPAIDSTQDPALTQDSNIPQNADPAAYSGKGKIYDFGDNIVVVDTDKSVFITVEETVTNQNFVTVQQSNVDPNANSYVTQIIAGDNVTITSTGANGTGQVTINANVPAGNGIPGGVDGQVQYNANGLFGASANFTFNPANGTVAATNVRAQYGFFATAELGNIDVGISSDPQHDAIFNNATDTALNIRSGNTANSANGIFLYTYGSDGDGTGGGEVDVGPNGVKIHGVWSANASNARTWNFANTGALTFPDSTVQNTAWTGTVDGANVTGQVSFAATANSVAGANVTGQVGSANFATFSSQADTALTVAGANVTGEVANAAFATTAGSANTAATAATANSVAVANVAGLGNIATTNYNGLGNSVLAGNGAWIPAATGGVSSLNAETGAVTIAAGSGINVTTSGGIITVTNTSNGGGNATPAGANTEVQFNANGAFGASANLTFNVTTNTLSTTNVAATQLQFADATVQNTAWTGTVSGANVSGTVANATFATTAGNAQTLNGFTQDVTAAANSIVLRDSVGRIAVNEVLGTISGSNVVGPVSSATTAGTVTANVQSNITSVGVLTSLQVGNGTSNISLDSSGITMPIATTLTAGRLVVQGANATLGPVGNVIITGGTNGQVLTTDGSGNLSWTTVSGGGNTTPGGANTQVQFNANGAFGGSANFTFSETGGIGGAPSIGVGQRIALVGNPVANTSHLLSSNELTVMSASGGNIVLDPSGNVVLPTVANVKMPGGTISQVLTTDGAGNLSFASIKAGSQVLVVDNTGSDSTGDGSLSKPFATLQAAHDYAVANIASFLWVTIQVNPGTYPAATNISRNFVLVDGQVDSWVTGLVTISAAAKNVRFSGLRLAGGFNATAGTTQCNYSFYNITAAGGNWDVTLTDSVGLESYFQVYNSVFLPGSFSLDITAGESYFYGSSLNGMFVQRTKVYATGSSFWEGTYTFNAGAVATISGCSSGSAAVINVDAISTIVADAAFLGPVTLNNNGTLTKTTKYSDITGTPTLGNIATINLNGNGSQVLAGNGAWVTQTGGGSLLNVANVTTTPFTVTANTQFLYVTNATATTVDLPETVVVGSEIIVKDGVGTNRVGNAITVSVANGTIDGNATYTINAAWNSVTFVGVGANTYAAI